MAVGIKLILAPKPVKPNFVWIVSRSSSESVVKQTNLDEIIAQSFENGRVIGAGGDFAEMDEAGRGWSSTKITILGLRAPRK